MTQQYSLRWNNHQPNFISMFATLLNTKTLVDVTLAAEGQHLQAHKVVLSACSTYFQALFVENPSQHPIVILKDVTFANLCTMVDFMYYGEVHVTEEQLPQVLDTAKTLKIKGLTEMPDSTSLTRSQGTSADFPAGEPVDQRNASSPAMPLRSPRRKKRSRSSSVEMITAGEEARLEACEGGGGGEEARGAELVPLSAVPPRRRDFEPPTHQNTEPQNLNVQQLSMEADPSGMPQGGQWSVMEHTYGRYGGVGGGDVYVGEGLEHAGGGGGGAGGGGDFPAALAHEPAPEPPPPRRRRTANPQAEENFQRALEAVRFGGIGFCKAARMFGVNNRTLWLEYKKKGYPNTRPSIKSRIKRENPTPPPPLKEPPQQMALVCSPHPVPVGFVDSRQIDFQQGYHSSPLNILGVNFNSMQ